MSDFLTNRRKGIGGSDIAAILGVSKFKTALEVYLSKTTDQPEQQGEHLYWGHALENPIIDRFIQDTGANVIRQPEMRRHPQHQWAIANADALIVDGAGNHHHSRNQNQQRIQKPRMGRRRHRRSTD